MFCCSIIACLAKISPRLLARSVARNHALALNLPILPLIAFGALSVLNGILHLIGLMLISMTVAMMMQYRMISREKSYLVI